MTLDRARLDGNLDAYDLKDAHDFISGLANVRELVQNALTAMTEHAYLTDGRLEELDEASNIDLGIMWRDLENGFDSARKEAQKRKLKNAELFAQSRGRKIAKDPTNSEIGRGRLGSATADVKAVPKLPRRGSPEFNSLLRFLGATDFAIEEKLMAVNWSHLSDYLSALVIEGKKPPFEMEFEQQMTATFRKNR